MGAGSSKVEEDRALQLCSERKKFVRQALDGRCSLAAAHATYVQSLRNTGTALRKFIEPEAPAESSLYTSTNATPEPLALTERSLSQFSLSPPSISRHVGVAETLSPTPSPPTSTMFQVNHMQFQGSYSTTVEERPASPVIRRVISSMISEDAAANDSEHSETRAFEGPPVPPGTPPWDFFGASHPIDHQFSFREENGMKQTHENIDNIEQLRVRETTTLHLDDEDKTSLSGTEQSRASEEFDESPTDILVRRFEDLNRVNGHNMASPSPTMPSARSVASETEFFRGEDGNSPDLSPLTGTPSRATFATDSRKTPIKEDRTGNRVVPKDFISSIKDIEFLFIKASESGKEVPRMLEANKLHFRPILAKTESGPIAFTYLRACFSCGEDGRQVPEEPVQNTVKYLTWHRTASSRSSSSRNLLGLNSKDNVEDASDNLFDNFCMVSGSHASTLDRLYAWERKLYDEVKASELVRKSYDMKCKHLRQLQSKHESSFKIDRTRAVIKDLHSRLRVAIHRIDSISKRIEELRDRELQPQLEELIEGLSRMWEVMFECHKRQFHIIAAAQIAEARLSTRSESHKHVTVHLQNELFALSSSFIKWINAQKFYLHAINNWLFKCVSISQPRKKRRGRQPPPIRDSGPPIYVTCGVWLELLTSSDEKKVADSIKGLAAETSRFLPRQERNIIKGLNRASSTRWKAEDGSESTVNMLRDDASEDWISGFDRFRSSMVGFLGQLNEYAASSVRNYGNLEKAIQDAKSKYDLFKSQSQVH